MVAGAPQSKREGRRDERRDGILDVARECFLAEGYAATSMSTIAARLGGSKGTHYNYFKSKEELFEAMMQRQCGALAETLFDLAHDAAQLFQLPLVIEEAPPGEDAIQVFLVAQLECDL